MGVGGSGSRRPDTGLGQQPGPGPLGSTGRPQLALELALHLPDTFSARYSGPLSSTQQEGFPKRGHCQNTLAHTQEYYSAFKKKEIPQYATTWVNLEDIILSVISESQKNKC